MPIEVRRFGVGHRRPDGPPGTTGIAGQVIESGRSGVIAELAFERACADHAPQQPQLDVLPRDRGRRLGRRRRRADPGPAGEAVVWPPDVLHAAWTDGAPMRAIVVEFAAPQLALSDVTEGQAVRIGPGEADDVSGEPASGARGARRVSRGEGRLAPRPPEPPPEGDNPEGEPGSRGRPAGRGPARGLADDRA